MLLTVHPENPQIRVLKQVAEDLQKGEVYLLPTDTVYSFVTTISEKKAIAKLYQLKDIAPNKPLSLFCKDFSMASEFIRMNNNQIFRWMKKNLPGPYTLIFPASPKLPHYTLTKQKNVGIRIIDHPVISGLLDILDVPLIGTSAYNPDEYITYPEELDLEFGKRVKGVVDAGPLEISFSTVLDMTTYPPEVIREGKGEINNF